MNIVWFVCVWKLKLPENFLSKEVIYLKANTTQIYENRENADILELVSKEHFKTVIYVCEISPTFGVKILIYLNKWNFFRFITFV